MLLALMAVWLVGSQMQRGVSCENVGMVALQAPYHLKEPEAAIQTWDRTRRSPLEWAPATCSLWPCQKPTTGQLLRGYEVPE